MRFRQILIVSLVVLPAILGIAVTWFASNWPAVQPFLMRAGIFWIAGLSLDVVVSLVTLGSRFTVSRSRNVSGLPFLGAVLATLSIAFTPGPLLFHRSFDGAYLVSFSPENGANGYDFALSLLPSIPPLLTIALIKLLEACLFLTASALISLGPAWLNSRVAGSRCGGLPR